MKLFAQLTGIEKAVELLRWLCVPVAAVLAWFVPKAISGLLMRSTVALLPGTLTAAGPDYRGYVYRGVSALIGAAVVVTGALVAPRFRPTTAIVLATVWTLLSFSSHVLVHLAHGTPHYFHFALEAVPAAGAAAYLVYFEKAKGREAA